MKIWNVCIIKRLKYQGNYPQLDELKKKNREKKNCMNLNQCLGEMFYRNDDNLDFDQRERKKINRYDIKTVQSNSARNGRYSHSQNAHLHHNYWPFIVIEWTIEEKKICDGTLLMKFTYEYISNYRNKFHNFFFCISISFRRFYHILWLLS